MLACLRQLDAKQVDNTLSQMGNAKMMLDEQEVFHYLWQVSRNVYRWGEDRANRSARVEEVLVVLLEHRINPLNIPNMWSMFFILDWMKNSGGWGGIMELCQRHEMTNPEGGGWIHTLCQGGLVQARGIQHSLDTAGQNTREVDLARTDRLGRTALEVLWSGLLENQVRVDQRGAVDLEIVLRITTHACQEMGVGRNCASIIACMEKSAHSWGGGEAGLTILRAASHIKRQNLAGVAGQIEQEQGAGEQLL